MEVEEGALHEGEKVHRARRPRGAPRDRGQPHRHAPAARRAARAPRHARAPGRLLRGPRQAALRLHPQRRAGARRAARRRGPRQRVDPAQRPRARRSRRRSTRPRPRARWRCSARSTATSCGWSRSATAPTRASCAAARTCARPSEIGLFKVTTETSSASNVRRIEALTGPAAVHYMRERDWLLHEIASVARTEPAKVPDRILELQAQAKEALKADAGRVRRGRAGAARGAGRRRARSWRSRCDGVDAKALMDVADRIKGRLGDNAAIVLGSVVGDRVHLVAAVTPSLVAARRQGRRDRQGRRAGRPAAGAAAATRWRRPAARTPTSSARRSRRRAARSKIEAAGASARAGAGLRQRALRLCRERSHRDARDADRGGRAPGHAARDEPARRPGARARDQAGRRGAPGRAQRRRYRSRRWRHATSRSGWGSGCRCPSTSTTSASPPSIAAARGGSGCGGLARRGGAARGLPGEARADDAGTRERDAEEERERARLEREARRRQRTAESPAVARAATAATGAATGGERAARRPRCTTTITTTTSRSECAGSARRRACRRPGRWARSAIPPKPHKPARPPPAPVRPRHPGDPAARGRGVRLRALPAVHGQRPRHRRRQRARRARAPRRSATCWPTRAWSTRRSSSGCARGCRASAASCGPGGSCCARTCPTARRWTRSRPRRRWRRPSSSRSPRGAHGARSCRSSSSSASRATTSPPRSAHRARRGCRAPSRRARSRATCSRRPTSCARAPTSRHWSSSSSRPSATRSSRSTCASPSARTSRTYDVLIIASMIEREAQLPSDRPLISAVIYNRLHQHMPLGIDATLRYALNDWTHPLRVSQLALQLALQHAQPPGPAADADRQPGPQLDPGRRAPGAQALPVLRRQAVRQRRPRVLLDRGPVPGRRGEVQRRARGQRRQEPVEVQVTAAGRAGLARGPQPLAGMQRAALRAVGLDGWRYQLLPVPPELFAETVRALPAAGFLGANVTIPHKEAALALADSATPLARTIGAANTLTFTDDGIAGRQHRRAGAARGDRRAAAQRARARRGRQRARRGPRAGRRGLRGVRHGTHPRSGSRDLPAQVVARPVEAEALVNCTPRRAERRRRAAADPAGYELVVDFVYRDRVARRSCAPPAGASSTASSCSSARARCRSRAGPAARRRWKPCARPSISPELGIKRTLAEWPMLVGRGGNARRDDRQAVPSSPSSRGRSRRCACACRAAARLERHHAADRARRHRRASCRTSSSSSATRPTRSVQAAIELARQQGSTPEAILLDQGAINQDQLSRAIAARHGLDHIDLGVFKVDMAAANLDLERERQALRGRADLVRQRAHACWWRWPIPPTCSSATTSRC